MVLLPLIVLVNGSSDDSLRFQSELLRASAKERKAEIQKKREANMVFTFRI
jgi:hypothetical protein